ncbi:MAG: hypothetical protein B6241_03285 [Spirochaetaceae bacterium 4572_59]|nr:MAG: hypothetical protein B6241_03285 [Spirochaetaceae bacterium 4572_59]
MRICYLSKKIVIFFSGLFIMSLGIAISVKANLGLAPISCIPYIYDGLTGILLKKIKLWQQSLNNTEWRIHWNHT